MNKNIPDKTSTAAFISLDNFKLKNV